MNPTDQRTIEQLLEELGAEEYPGDPSHRYTLRRTLLNSRYFEVHRARVVWERIITISGPAFAGGFVLAMVVLAVHVYNGPHGGVLPQAQAQVVQAEFGPEILPNEEPEYVADATGLPAVDVVDFRDHEPVVRFVDFVNSNVQTALAQ